MPPAAENPDMWMSLGVFGLIAVLVGVSFRVAIFMGQRRVRFAFEDREDFMVLKVERRLAYDDSALITMTFLREAVRLKLRSDYKRLIVDVRKLTIADESGFWILIGGLGPILLTDAIKTAVVCRQKNDTGKRFEQSELVEMFESESAALSFLRSPEPARAVILDREWLESLLFARDRVSPLPRRRAA